MGAQRLCPVCMKEQPYESSEGEEPSCSVCGWTMSAAVKRASRERLERGRAYIKYAGIGIVVLVLFGGWLMAPDQMASATTRGLVKGMTLVVLYGVIALPVFLWRLLKARREGK